MVNNRLGDNTIRPVGSSSIHVGYGTLFVCAFSTSTVYKSSDGGATWDAGTVISGAGQVSGICLLANGWLLATGYNSGKVFKSVDNGATWDSGTFVSLLLTGIRQLANGSVVLVERTSNKLFTSVDNGATWDAGVSVGGTILQAVLQLADGSVVVTSYSSGKIFKSADNGATWDAGVLVGAQLRGVCQLPNGDILCAGAEKVYKSVDNGATWDAGTAVTGINNRLLYDEGIVYASSLSTGMYKSVDSGATWVNIGTPAASATWGMVMNPPRLLTVPSEASGLMLQCSCATPAYWRTDCCTRKGFRITNTTNPVTVWFDPSQVQQIFLDYVSGSLVKYQFITH